MTCQIEWGKYFVYDPESGLITNRIYRSPNAQAGTVVGCLKDNGYLTVRLNGKLHYVHRIAWDLIHPNDPLKPVEEIDHINHDRSDNRAVNLRKVSRLSNSVNQSLRRTNTSGQMGVCWHRASGKWTAVIMVDGATKYLGLFADKHEAIAARKAAEEKYGFHENHGK